MKIYDAQNIRNIVLAGHASKGKTTLAEALLSGDLGRSSFSLHEAVLIQGSHRFLAAWGTHCRLIDGAHRRHQLEALVAEFLSF